MGTMSNSTQEDEVALDLEQVSHHEVQLQGLLVEDAFAALAALPPSR
jgi:hypothetical protein